MNNTFTLNKLFWPVVYLALIVFCNWLIVVTPPFSFLGQMVPPVMLVVGFVFVFRDFAQRAIGHWVLPLMAVAAILSYWLASPAVAIASTTAFAISEIIDWAIFTYTKKPLKDRILYSSALSVPADTAIFLALIGFFSWPAMLLITVLKMTSTFICWLILYYRQSSTADAEQQPVVSTEPTVLELANAVKINNELMLNFLKELPVAGLNLADDEDKAEYETLMSNIEQGLYPVWTINQDVVTVYVGSSSVVFDSSESSHTLAQLIELAHGEQ